MYLQSATLILTLFQVFGVPKSVVKEADQLLMIMWSINQIFIFMVMVVLSASLVL
jgi:hypothetical protein